MEVVEEGAVEVEVTTSPRRRLLVTALGLGLVGVVVGLGLSRSEGRPAEPVELSVDGGPVELTVVDGLFQLAGGDSILSSSDGVDWSSGSDDGGLSLSAAVVGNCSGPLFELAAIAADGSALGADRLRLDVPGIGNDVCFDVTVTNPISTDAGWAAVVRAEVGAGIRDINAAGPWMIPVSSHDGSTWTAHPSFTGNLAGVRAEGAAMTVLSWSDHSRTIRITQIDLTDAAAAPVHAVVERWGGGVGGITSVRFIADGRGVAVVGSEGQDSLLVLDAATSSATAMPLPLSSLDVVSVDDELRLIAVDTAPLALLASEPGGFGLVRRAVEIDEPLTPIGVARLDDTVAIAFADLAQPSTVRVLTVDASEW